MDGNLSAWARRNWWQVVVLTLGGWTGFYFALILPIHLQYTREISAQRSSGLAAVAGYDPVALWRQSSVWDVFRNPQIAARRERNEASALGLSLPESPKVRSSVENRYILRSAQLDLEVRNPADCAETIRELALRMDGYLVSSEIGNDQYARGANVIVRVPVSRFEQMLAELKKLAVRVEHEKLDANDVTKEYIDKEARLRNLQTEEARYLTILEHATTIRDTLEVSNKLGQVRGEIEQQQIEFATLAKQVDTVVIAVSLDAEADTQVFGMHWRPLYELKTAARNGLESLAAYAALMTMAIFRLPAFLLWIATIVFIASIAWRSMRWVRKTFFAPSHP